MYPCMYVCKYINLLAHSVMTVDIIVLSLWWILFVLFCFVLFGLVYAKSIFIHINSSISNNSV